MIKNQINKHLLEYHHVQRKKNVAQNLKSAVQSLADSCRYIESACEEITDPKLLQKLIKIKTTIMTDSGLGGGFDERKDPDVISDLQKIVDALHKNIDHLNKKYDLPTF